MKLKLLLPRVCLLIASIAACTNLVRAQTESDLPVEQPAPIQEQRKTWAYDQWPQQFIDRALCLCMLAGYPDSVASRIRQTDRYYADPVAVSFFDSTLQVLLVPEIQAIRDEAERSRLRLAEGRGGKPDIAGHCLEFYRSARLQQALRTARRRWEQVTDIQGEIQRVIPTY